MELSLGGRKAWNSHVPQMARSIPGRETGTDAPLLEHARQLDAITLRIATCRILEQALPPLLSELLAVIRCGLPDRTLSTDGLAAATRERKMVSSSDMYVLHRHPALRDGCVMAPSGMAIPASTRQWLVSAMAARDTVNDLKPSALPPGSLMALTTQGEATASWLWLDESLAESTLCRPAIDALSRGLTLQYQRQAQQTADIQAAVADAVQAERRSLAAELHDTLAQELSYLQMQTSRLTRAARQAPSKVQTLAEDVHVQTRRAFRQTRELINGAHAKWGEDPLACVLDELIEEFETRSNMVFELDNRIQSLHLSDAESLQVMFIVREALTNSVRHAHATHLRLQLLYRQTNEVSVTIEDNGTGFDPAEIVPAHFGLGIMQDRARSIGAQFSITQCRHGGTRVTIRWERNAR